MKIAKRFLLIIGFIPCFFIGGIKWIFTGKTPDIMVESFINFCEK